MMFQDGHLVKMWLCYYNYIVYVMPRFTVYVDKPNDRDPFRINGCCNLENIHAFSNDIPSGITSSSSDSFTGEHLVMSRSNHQSFGVSLCGARAEAFKRALPVKIANIDM
jgi:hypothetical protein